MRFWLVMPLMLFGISVGLWPGWLGPRWLVLGRPDLASAALALVVIGAVVAIDWWMDGRGKG